MQICMLGLSYKTAEVDVREKVAFNRPVLGDALHALCRYDSVRGAVILSTCNRMEIYVDSSDASAAYADIVAFIEAFKHVDRAEFEGHLYRRQGFEAVHHLFGVISSLDSMVLGEQQILGQVRTAFRSAMEAGSCTMALAHMFRQALSCGKRVRNETSVSENHVSLSTVAVDVARAEFETLKGKTVLVLGSGEMSELAAQYLKEQGVETFFVSSRTYAHACTLARELGGVARQFTDLPELIGEADIVISATAAPHCIITPELLAHTAKHLLILDIALPRDVDDACRSVPNVTVCNLDDIGEIIERNQEERKAAAARANDIVDEETRSFLYWVGEHAVTPTIKRMRADAEDMRQREFDRLMKALSVDLSEEDRWAVQKATEAIVKKLLHEPTVRLKESTRNNADFECVEAVRYLWGYSNGMVAHAHALDAGEIAAPHTVPSHASANHPM